MFWSFVEKESWKEIGDHPDDDFSCRYILYIIRVQYSQAGCIVISRSSYCISFPFLSFPISFAAIWFGWDFPDTQILTAHAIYVFHVLSLIRCFFLCSVIPVVQDFIVRDQVKKSVNRRCRLGGKIVYRS